MSTHDDIVGDRLLELFRNRCIGVYEHCDERATCVHEINGRRRKPWNIPLNRVPLCLACHNWIHRTKGNSEAIREATRYFRNRKMKQFEITWEDVEACYKDQQST